MPSGALLHRLMTRSPDLLGALTRALMTTLVAALALTGVAHPVSARTITNVATISWEANGTQLSRSSNRVDLDVSISAPVGLKTYRLETGSSQAVDLVGSSCQASGQKGSSFVFDGVYRGISPGSTPVIETQEIHAGEPLVIEIYRPGANINPLAADELTVTVQTTEGDSETLTLVESAPDSARFYGIVATIPSPPPGLSGDCQLSVFPGDTLTLSALDANATQPFATSPFKVLVDPFGIAFSSSDGTPVDGTRVTVVSADSGQPAEVFGDDGVSSFPSTLETGSTVSDSSGHSYSFPPGEYRFPMMKPGRYRLIVEPPAPYVAPSSATSQELAQLRRPDGGSFVINAGSYGGVFVLATPHPVQVDLPLDKPTTPLLLSKTASVAVAEPGDTVQYRVTVTNPSSTQASTTAVVTDLVPASMRFRTGTVRVNGSKVAPLISGDGRRLDIEIPPLGPSGSAVVTYALEVRPDAREGDALNRAEVVDSSGLRSNVGDALVRIRRDVISGRMTITGRVLDGDCSVKATGAKGIAGVRIMLEDGSYAVTDADGRYHFEGVQPGLHVVQLDDHSLPSDRRAVDCARNTRSAGRAFSRFVEGYGGALKRVDFRAAQAPQRDAPRGAATERAHPLSDPAAAGAERDWFAGQQPGIGWLFPETDHNPRAPVVRVAIKHLPGQAVKLLVGGKPADPIAFDGTRKSGDGRIAVSLWRGIPLTGRDTRLSAEVRNGEGTLVETLTRTVHFAASPLQATLLPDRSVLVADGVTRPIIALRMTDRDGRPVHNGLVGDFEVPAPYYPAVEADAQQARQLAGLERARPVWRIEGDDGVAYVELEPTTASGSLSLRFNFRDGETIREQRVEAWLSPGDRPWTIVGLAEGTVGYAKLKGHVEGLGGDEDGVFADGRVALYAKGRISGKWLMTLAYDSDKEREESRFGGVIDPSAYYTIYADRSERRFDAASIRKLYLKLERPQFYALFGDYETGIDEPQLTRYVRSFNGIKAEYRSERLSATTFAADTPNRYRRDEFQGNGLSGPYGLGGRDILANSERVTLEIRDRLRSDRIVEQRLLSRHIDYDIDYVAGTLRFREPILSRDSELNPQFIIVEYEVDGIASRSLNAGGRIAVRTRNQKLQVAATVIRDKDDGGQTVVAGADLRYRPSAATEVRAEIAISDAKPSATGADGDANVAWLVEAEHHGPRLDLLAYARQQDSGFGVGQQNSGENGSRKLGVDGRLRIAEKWTLSGSAWHEDYLTSDARRIAGKGLIEYRTPGLAARIGLTFADDRLEDGRSSRSNILQFGVTKKLFRNRLELDAQSEMPIGGKDQSIDFPARHRLSARFAVTNDIHLVGTYEMAKGEHVDAHTARIGFDLTPWAGARIAASANVQNIAEYGPRTFASLGLAQSLVLSKHWSVDLSLDSNKTVGGIDPTRVLNPLHPVASGGFVGRGETITEDFVAVTAGATYRSDRWSVTSRAEYRAGDRDDRYGFTAAALRQIGEGRAVGASFNWFTAKSENGARTRTMNLQFSWAHQPTNSAFSWLDKLEIRSDSVRNAVAGLPAPIGGPLNVTGDARSRRIVNSLSVNWSPATNRSGEFLARTEASFFWGTRYVTDRYGADDIKGWSNVVGADFRFSITDTVDVGASAMVRAGIGAQSFAYSGGPNVGIKPFQNGWILIGWNIRGFEDRDFEEAQYSRSGPYVTMRFKFDQQTFQGLGLARR